TDERECRKYKALLLPWTQEAERDARQFHGGEGAVSVRSNTAVNSHERFEELAALALIGELSEREQKELLDHLKSCEPCLQEYAAYDGILSHQLPLLHQERGSVSVARKHSSAEELPVVENDTPSLGVLESWPKLHADLS